MKLAGFFFGSDRASSISMTGMTGYMHMKEGLREDSGYRRIMEEDCGQPLRLLSDSDMPADFISGQLIPDILFLRKKKSPAKPSLNFNMCMISRVSES